MSEISNWTVKLSIELFCKADKIKIRLTKDNNYSLRGFLWMPATAHVVWIQAESNKITKWNLCLYECTQEHIVCEIVYAKGHLTVSWKTGLTFSVLNLKPCFNTLEHIQGGGYNSMYMLLYWIALLYLLFCPCSVGGHGCWSWVLHTTHRPPPGTRLQVFLRSTKHMWTGF